MEKEYFRISPNRYTIGGLDSMLRGERVFEISFFDIANSGRFVKAMNLVYLEGRGMNYNYEQRGKSFAGYVGAFMENSKKTAHLRTNPKVLILIQDEKVLKVFKEEFLS